MAYQSAPHRIKPVDILPAIRIIIVEAAELCYGEIYKKEDLIIKNSKDCFDNHFSDLMPPNLDLFYLNEQGKLDLKKIGEEYYTYDFVNVVFNYPLRVDENNNRVYKKEEADATKTIIQNDLRKLLYTTGFVLNGKRYVRYKRSAGSAKSGSCLFIKEKLYPMMERWSKAGLSENKDLCLNSLTSYEAYKALSLSSLIAALKLKPHNILFVKDFEYKMMNQEVIKVAYDDKKGLVPTKESCEVTNNLFDGEGLLDDLGFAFNNMGSKGMVLLRNRFFKCCAFHTKLQQWFKENKITSVDQLNGITFATDIADIRLVVSESCLKYLKMCKGGFNEKNIKRWCNAISDEDGFSTFGIVKTDKRSRFFGGDMVETTYQLLNTLQLNGKNVSTLLVPYMDYIRKIRDINKTPEFARLFLEGEIGELDEGYDDDSEDQPIEEELFNYSAYSFKNKICLDLIKTKKDIIYTNLFKKHIFENIISSFRLKLYGGRVLINGTYATLFGNPLEFLKYIIKVNDKPLFNHDNVSSSLGKGEIYSTFFADNEELVGSRAPHMTMGNILCAKNKRLRDVDKWFRLSRYIVVVDAINNNIQQRLNGADYDSDSMLITNNEIIVKAAKVNYDLFPVPYVAFGHKDKPIENLLGKDINKFTSQDFKNNVVLNIHKIDCHIADNNTGSIVNLSQKLNSHLWNSFKNKNKIEELYKEIAVLAVLAGAEIDSAKRTFSFNTITELNRVRKFAKEKGYTKRPVFFYFVTGEDGRRRPKINEIENYINTLKDDDYLKTTMDIVWKKGRVSFKSKKVKTVSLFRLITRAISSKGLSGPNYDQINKAIIDLTTTKDIINKAKQAKRLSDSYDLEKRNFQVEIDKCYGRIKTAINSPKKVKYMIGLIEAEGKTPYALLFLLLYIVSLRSKELGYKLSDLFDSDGGIAKLNQVRKKTNYVLFDKYYYERDVIDSLLAAIF